MPYNLYILCRHGLYMSLVLSRPLALPSTTLRFPQRPCYLLKATSERRFQGHLELHFCEAENSLTIQASYEGMSSTTEPLTLEQALAGRKFSWTSGVLVLNAILSVVQLSSYATGYDGSMMSESSCL